MRRIWRALGVGQLNGAPSPSEMVTEADGAPPSEAAMHAGASRLAAGQICEFVTRLATSVAFAKLLSPREIGLFGLITVLTILLQRTVGDGGLTNALVQRREVSPALASTALYTNILVGFATTAILFVGAPWITSALGDRAATGVMRGMAFTFLIAAFSRVPKALLRRSFRYGAVASLGSVNALVTGAVAVPLAAAGHGVASIVIGTVSATAVDTVLTWKLARWRPSARFSMTELRSVGSFARNLTAFNFANYLSSAGDKFIVGRFVGTSALGLYSLPYRVLFAPIFSIAQVYGQLLLPVFSRQQDDNEAISRTYLRSVSAMTVVTFPLCAGMAIVAQPLVDSTLAPEWRDAGPILSVMSVVALLQSVLVTGGVILTAKGRTDILLRWGAFAGIVMFGFYGAGAAFGATGVAVGFLAGTVVLAYPAMKLPFRQIELPVRRLVTLLAPVTVATCVLATAALATRLLTEASGMSSTTVLWSTTLAGVLGYAVGHLWARPPGAADVIAMVVRRRPR